MTELELTPLVEEVAVTVAPPALVTFFSVQEAERGSAPRRPGTLHKPLDARAEQALEVSVLSLCGREPSRPRRLLLLAATLTALAVCGLAGWYYPRDPHFTLTEVQKLFGFAGIFAVLAAALFLSAAWFPGTYCRCTTAPCPLRSAQSLLFVCEDGSEQVLSVVERRGCSGEQLRCATFRQLRFVFEPALDAFVVELAVDPLANAAALGLRVTEGLAEEEAARRARWHGRNLIDVPMPSVAQQLTDEILNPFVFFQLFSCVQWLLQQYWHYSLIVFAITLAAAAFSLVSSRRSFRRLRDLSRHVVPVAVRRGGAATRTIPSEELVPGDIFEVAEGLDLPCDALLVQGECLVSEAMLTGESVPVAKAALAGVRSLLSGGTRVLQTSAAEPGGAVLARVSRTGFSTEKGRLVRSILFPRAGRMDLTRDGNRFVAYVLVPMAVAGGVASCVHALSLPGGEFTLASALDLVSIAVPPALPAAMMVGIATAVERLRRRDIFCIAPNRVNMGGRVTQVCFDKTGTLTLDGLTMLGLRPVRPAGGAVFFGEEVPGSQVAALCDISALDAPAHFLALVMAACQSLRRLEGSGGLVGDPLEVVMLESCAWRMTSSAVGTRLESPSRALVATQLQSFDFNSELARMAVVVRLGEEPSAAVRSLVKGSPEAIASLCDAATLPSDFEAVLAAYAGGGYRVIGCAERLLDAREAAAAAAGTLERSAAERPGALRFVGLVALENRLKPTSAAVVAALRAADMGVCMVTGDHARTAVTVARAANILGRQDECVLVDAQPGGPAAYTLLALSPGEGVPDRPLPAEEALGEACSACRFVATGAGFAALSAAAEGGDAAPLRCIMRRLSVAARFQPHQKQGVVGMFIERGDYTAFVGDGANDSAALKAADVGLSLTADAEASVAAPFTSRGADIGAIVTLLLEGRAALATSFQLFKFMALYAMCQFSTALRARPAQACPAHLTPSTQR